MRSGKESSCFSVPIPFSEQNKRRMCVACKACRRIIACRGAQLPAGDTVSTMPHEKPFGGTFLVLMLSFALRVLDVDHVCTSKQQSQSRPTHVFFGY